ncbi:fat storage-inducing transmembrane protein 1 [Lampris incognitus]|uniref:fat storage-inducing transmembrane protein 1 n=1 Tax=Lampris incognitus TaxID=2546036 RepID=UPI0024B4E556|nr:fat storage-inducing transmembrane protein 1 [Lampris incognitus]
MKTETSSNGSVPEINLEKLHKIAAELPGRLVLRLLNVALLFLTSLLARILGSRLVKHHLHLLLSALVLFGPVLSFWASKYSIFANRNNYLYRKFLLSAWGWTCIFTGSFVFLFSFSACRSLSLSLRHLSRILAVGGLWRCCRHLLTLLENAAGTCYEPVAAAQEGGPIQGSGSTGQPLLLLHEDQTKTSCLRAGMVWRGYEVSQDTLILCLCCLLLVEEMSVFCPRLARVKAPQRFSEAPLRTIFLLCVLLLALWMFLLLCQLTYFPQFPSQLLGGALGYLGWRVLYQGWFKFRPHWGCPGSPGEGLPTNTDMDVH